ncbi:hypothetical protein [Phaeobacter sp. 22II1-1F12B]|uniref:hypothetical protein n=1 Tax=Phaeobacter sp. 22II1-1F12B TaxID=1317111 RepID=UPI000B520F05|nr:hypothetical protein [Phaeobacter sp. 22II1-1F12B]OWU79478.1 hypothetical protein ATO1_12375 [Phaeobacter sp. 22II1-1F12B]
MSIVDEVNHILGRLNALGGTQPSHGTLAMAGGFILCWGKFEHDCLGMIGQAQLDQAPLNYRTSIQNFSANKIPENADFSKFQPSFDFFRERYHRIPRPTEHFAALIQADHSARHRIEQVLNAGPNSTREKVEALLLIAYRLRGNLVHGQKWTSGLDDQVGNFTHASRVLLGATEVSREPSATRS